ncbi:MAG TPA: YfhO family protein [Candidatus Saccharimonadales bacterium]|nr:YfhO family protein [Candidatus Saccharimonadales bacterium]
MKKFIFLPVVFLFVTILFFFHSFFLQGKLPIPSDTIVGLYHPFRDLYSQEYPNGIPYKNFLITDPVRQQYPWRFLAVSLEKTGQLPLWNPYNFGGTPLLANFQTAAFNPFNSLFFIMPFPIAWSLLIFLQQILAGIFMYLYLSNLKLRSPAKFLGSIVYVFCGAMIAWLEWGTLDQVIAWLPLILLSVDKLFMWFSVEKDKQSVKNKKEILWSLVFLLSFMCSFFSGHLQLFFYLSLIFLVYVIARWIQFGRMVRSATVFVLLAGCFVVVTSIQWIPTLEFILQSARNADQLNGWQQAGWFVPWQNLIQFVAPDFFGNPTTLNYWGIWNYGEFIGYIGIFPLIMAIFALFYRHDRKTLFFGTFFFLSLIFSLPTIFAQIPYILHIPFLATSQPTRLLFVTDFSLSILSALGLDYYLRSEKKRTILYPTLFIFIVFAGLWVFIFAGSKLLHLDPVSISIAKHNLYLPTILFMLIAVIVANTVFIKQPRVRTSLIIVLLCISVVDLFRFADKFIPFTAKDYLFPEASSLSYLQNQKGQFRIMETDSEILPPNFSVMYHLQSVDGYDPLYLERYGELMASIGRNKPDIRPPFGFNRIITPTNFQSRLIDLMGVKYVLSLTEIKDAKLTKVFSEEQTRVYKNTSAFPRAFLVSQVRPAATKQEAIDLLFNQKINLHTTAIVEGVSKSLTNLSNGSATITDYQPNSVAVDTKSNGNSFLVLVDTFYPSWHVTVDGKDQVIYQTDYNFRGVEVPKGNHHIIFSDSLL